MFVGSGWLFKIELRVPLGGSLLMFLKITVVYCVNSLSAGCNRVCWCGLFLLALQALNLCFFFCFWLWVLLVFGLVEAVGDFCCCGATVFAAFYACPVCFNKFTHSSKKKYGWSSAFPSLELKLWPNLSKHGSVRPHYILFSPCSYNGFPNLLGKKNKL